MFTEIKPENRFTTEEMDEIYGLMRENDLLRRFIIALWDDRNSVMKTALEWRGNSART
ncbi:hypothetical protein [Paenibacillus chitinolyticus]|uniref:Uncharacterized protein n=1 Tax=Paenibacillus chitinolyticus TaxID=79263 RepID=A0ABT4FQT2_9BACL|nr:hypothetical protein [Paenibacillus chitinolyticus]MCY9593964.1 hypothetical protein [Paenibacillus chitinolyticus]MCY9599619.1 hypothetical protein [Paenibacillus chitinolyticus]